MYLYLHLIFLPPSLLKDNDHLVFIQSIESDHGETSNKGTTVDTTPATPSIPYRHLEFASAQVMLTGPDLSPKRHFQ